MTPVPENLNLAVCPTAVFSFSGFCETVHWTLSQKMPITCACDRQRNRCASVPHGNGQNKNGQRHAHRLCSAHSLRRICHRRKMSMFCSITSLSPQPVPAPILRGVFSDQPRAECTLTAGISLCNRVFTFQGS